MQAQPEQASIEVGAVLDNAPISGLPALVILFCALALVIDGFDIQAVSYAGPALVAEWGVAKAALGPVLAASLFGMAVGALSAGPAGDRYGRKAGLIACLLIISVTTLLCALATSMTQLLILRFITGIGMGGLLPNMTALMAEYTPPRWRPMLVTLILIAVPVGGMLGAEVAVHLVPVWGWRSIFVIGGLLPLVLALALLFWAPESVRFLVRQGKNPVRIAALMNRLDPTRHYTGQDHYTLSEPAPAGRSTVSALFSSDYIRDTSTLWLVFLCAVFALFAHVNWVPTLMTELKFDPAAAANALFYFNFGGVLGTIAIAPFVMRYGSRVCLALCTLAGALAAYLLGHTPIELVNGTPTAASLNLMIGGLMASGACIMALQSTLYAVAAHIYPTAIRSTGVGWGLGIGRFGGILSAFSGSVVLHFGIGVSGFFTIIAAALGLAVVGLLLMRRHIPAR